MIRLSFTLKYLLFCSQWSTHFEWHEIHTIELLHFFQTQKNIKVLTNSGKPLDFCFLMWENESSAFISFPFTLVEIFNWNENKLQLSGVCTCYETIERVTPLLSIIDIMWFIEHWMKMKSYQTVERWNSSFDLKIPSHPHNDPSDYMDSS